MIRLKCDTCHFQRGPSNRLTTMSHKIDVLFTVNSREVFDDVEKGSGVTSGISPHEIRQQ